MTKKIFRSIMLVAMAALLAGLAVVTAPPTASFWPIRRPTRKRWKTTPGARKCDRRLKPGRARAAAIPPR